MERDRVRWGAINRKIARIDGALVDRVTEVHNEVSRLGRYDAAAGRVSAGHSEPNQLSIGEGVLLGSGADSHAPVRP